MKHPTTARNTPPAKPPSPRTGPPGLAEDVTQRSIPPSGVRAAWLAGFCLAAWWALAAAGARADDSSEPARSTGKNGHQLQWLPYRPTVPKVDPNVRPTAHVAEPGLARGHREPLVPTEVATKAHEKAPANTPDQNVPRTAARPPVARGPGSTFNDPFGDREAEPAEPARPDSASLAQQARQEQQEQFLPPVGPPGPSGTELPPLDDDPLRLDEPSRMDDLSPARELGPPAGEALPLPAPPGEDEPLSIEPLAPRETDDETLDDAPRRPRRRDLDELDLDEGYVRERADITLKCVSPEDFRPLTEISTDIAPRGDLPKECPLSDKIFDLETPRPWCPLTFTWKASGLCHKPLYFEQVHLERYGHSWGPYVQPFVSGAHFFLTVPILPYKMGLYPPNECMYSLGYYRPGNCAPYLLDPIPLSVRAGLAQAGAWVGGIYVIP